MIKKTNRFGSMLFGVCLAVLIGMFAGCSEFRTNGNAAENGGSDSQAEERAEIEIPDADYRESDTDSGYRVAGGGEIALSDQTVRITSGGTYTLSGVCAGGKVTVSVPQSEEVKLILSGVTITSQSGAAIEILQAAKAIITLSEGSQNVLEDGGSDEEDASALYSKCDLSINGEGSLTVRGMRNDAIKCKKILRITGGAISVNAVDDGIVVKSGYAQNGGKVSISGGGDGIKTGDAETGYIRIDGGDLQVTAANDGLQAESVLSIGGGNLNLTCGGGADAALGSGESAKAIKCAGDIKITDGTIALDASDDGVHSNGTILIEGGDFTMRSGDDGIHADALLEISGGGIAVTKSYEGIESQIVRLTGGSLDITSGDDGINAAGGNDGSGSSLRPDTFQGGADGGMIYIYGGDITVDAGGDGLDANGSIVMSGGSVVIFGPTGGANGAIDYDGSFTVTGGRLVALGAAGMTQAISTTSSQYCISLTLSSAAAQASRLQIEDQSGNVIYTAAVKKSYQSAVLCLPEFQKASTYIVTAGGSDYSVTISSIVTSFGSGGGHGGIPGR